MAKAQQGDTVCVHYTGTLEDGTVFDSSVGREPLEFTLGSSQVIPGFEDAVLGLEPGESRTVTIPAEQAYGRTATIWWRASGVTSFRMICSRKLASICNCRDRTSRSSW